MLQISTQSIYTGVILILFTYKTVQDQPVTTAGDEANNNQFDDENPGRAPTPPALNFNNYFAIGEIYSYYHKEAHPLLEWSEIGDTSSAKKAIRVATIRNPKKKQKRAIFIDALMIPCEYHTASIVMYIMNELLLNSSLYQDILDTTTLHIVPIANRDGFEANFAKTSSLTPKHARERGLQIFNKEETFKNLKPNPGCTGGSACTGTNIALNFPFQWTALPSRIIRNFTFKIPGNPPSELNVTDIFEFDSASSPHYRGAQACSEAECQAILNFLKSHKEIDTYVTLHGFINFWAFPYAYKDKKRPDNYKELGTLAAAVTEAINEAGHETSRYGPFQNMFDLEENEVFNGKEHPGTPLDYAKSIGIRFVYWAAFGEYNYPRYLEQDILRVCQDAFRGFLVLFRLRDKHNRPVFPSKSTLLHNYPLIAILCISLQIFAIS